MGADIATGGAAGFGFADKDVPIVLLLSFLPPFLSLGTYIRTDYMYL